MTQKPATLCRHSLSVQHYCDIILVAGSNGEGAAIATTVSQGISMVLGIIYLKKTILLTSSPVAP